MCFFSVFEGQELRESCPKNSKFSSGKTYFPTIFSKKSFPFCKNLPQKLCCCPARTEIVNICPTFFKNNQLPKFIMSIRGFLSLLLKHFAPMHMPNYSFLSKLSFISLPVQQSRRIMETKGKVVKDLFEKPHLKHFVCFVLF